LIRIGWKNHHDLVSFEDYRKYESGKGKVPRKVFNVLQKEMKQSVEDEE